MGNYINIYEFSQRVTPAQITKVLTSLNYTANTQQANSFLEGLISRAESLVDSYVGSIYAVPVPKSPMVQEWTLRFAEYDFYKHGSGSDVQTKFKDSYNEALAQMKDCLKGLIRIPGKSLRNPIVGDSIVVSSEHAYFTSHRPDGTRNANLF